ncbi:STAS domain-containing protein [Desulfovibrio sp. SGI.169]|uniref:STAS domain-containing protein n=1 Tax=Desulfovibrio sp. SGI.169 TaxID=3420561 RepID=UPI003D03D8F7
MRISTHMDGQTLTVELEGRLDTATTPQVSEALQDCPDKCDLCILDFANVDYISSAGLRLLLLLHKRMGTAGGGLTLRRVQPGVRDILDMTGFTAFLRME